MLGANPLWGKAPYLTDKDLSNPPSNIIRTCCAFGMDLKIASIPFIKKTDITSIGSIGPHHYLGAHDEGNGIVYTKRGGFIDLGHVRDCADWTAFLYTLIQSVEKNSHDIVLDLSPEGGDKTLAIENIQSIDGLKILEVAGKIAYDLSVWHEIATWFGASYIPMIPERYSSFSPEDLYSNLLGVTLGMQAVKSDLEYNEAMTMLIANALDSLGAVSSIEETYSAMEEVEDIWWTGKKRLPSRNILLQRYLDSDKFLMPWLLPDDKSTQNPCKLFKPDAGNSEFYTLQIKLTKKIPNAPENRIITQSDFGWLIRDIENEQKLNDLKIAIKEQKNYLRKERKGQSTEHVKS